MFTSSSNIQAVFLVDVSTYKHYGSKWEQAITLCIFRILSFLNSQLQPVDPSKPSTKSIKWGYRLFDIDEKISRISSGASGFQSFKLKNFQSFEKNMRSMIQTIQTAIPSPAACQQRQTKSSLAARPHPAQCLSKHLTEILHDFSWQLPDVGSPVKNRKGFNPAENETQSNYVFLISRVPCDKKALRHFCNLVVMDKNVFLESILPQVLRKQFHIQHKIQLHWVEIGRYLHPDDSANSVASDKKCYEMVRQSLKAVGGVLVPFHSLVTHMASKPDQSFGTCSDGEGDSSVHSLAGEEMGTESGRDQVTALLSSFASMSVCSALIPCWTTGKNRATKKGTGDSSVATLVIQKQGEGHTDVVLKLVPITEKKLTSSQAASDQQELQLHAGDYTDSVCCLLRNSSIMARRSHSRWYTQLEVRACMKQSQMRLLGANLGRHCVCVLTENATSDQIQAFSALLQTIHVQQLTLVMSMKVGSEISPYLVLLEASSNRSAYLSYLSLSLTLQLEKVMTWQGHIQQSEDDTEDLPVMEVRDKVSRACSAQSVQTQQQRCPDESSDGDRLWTGVLNPWHVPGSVPQLQSTLDRLTHRVPRVAERSALESSMLQDLKQAYRQEKQPPFLQPTLQSTPMLTTCTSLTPHSVTGSLEQSNSSQDDLSGSESRGSTHGGDSQLSRGRVMLRKARSMASVSSVSLDELDGDFVPSSVATDVMTSKADSKVEPLRSESGISRVVVQSAEDLAQFVEDQYQSVLQAGADMENTVQSIMSITQQYMISQDSACPQKLVVEFMKEKILKTNEELKSRYMKQNMDQSASTRVTEIKLQVLLHLEIVSMCSRMDQMEQEDFTEQVVDLLRSVVFGTRSGEVANFLNKIVLKNYLSTLPNMLVTVYRELTQPLPSALRPFSSPDRGPSLHPFSSPARGPTLLPVVSPDLSQCSQDSQSFSSALLSDSHSAEPSMRRTRSSTRSHPSLVGLGNKRQILVPKKHVPKSKGSKSKKSKGKTKTDCKSPGKNQKGKKARRSLFSVASKGDHAPSSKTTPRKKQHYSSSDQQTTSQTLVAETPHHRQKTRWAWQQEQITKEPTAWDASDVQVIAESPVKDIPPEQGQTTPGRCKAPRRVLRKAFYSTTTERTSRTLTRALSKSENTSGQPHLFDVRETKPGRLSEALSDSRRKRTLSPRGQAVALLLGGERSPSPAPSGSSGVRGSRTPQPSRQKLLYEDTRSMPAISSVVKILDFSSPVKMAVSDKALTSPVTRGRQRLLIMNTPTKEGSGIDTTPTKSTAGCSSQITPVKRRTTPQKRPAARKEGTPTQCRKRVAGLSSSKRSWQGQAEEKGCRQVRRTAHSSSRVPCQQSSILNYISPSGKSAVSRFTPVSPELLPQGGQSGPNKSTVNTERGDSVTQQPGHTMDAEVNSALSSPVSRRHRFGAVESDVEQMSPCNLFLPKRTSKQNLTKDLQAEPESKIPLTRGTSSASVSKISNAVGFNLRSGSSGIDISAKATELTLSPVKTAVKSLFRNSSPLKPQQFASPTKTPTKPILRNSQMARPHVHTGSAHTVQESARLTLDTESQHGCSLSPSPENMADWGNWQHRKRRHSDDKSSYSLCDREPCSDTHTQPGKSRAAGTAVVKSKKRVTSSETFRQGASAASADSTSHFDSITKQTFPFSNTEFSSPCKRRRTDSLSKVAISKPTLFSENAMDSYFSASNDAVFLGGSSLGPVVPPSGLSGQDCGSDRQGSPHFKDRLKGKSCLESSQGIQLAASKSSCESVVGGSQGFETAAVKASRRSASPVFSTSPAQKRKRKVGFRTDTSDTGKGKRESSSRCEISSKMASQKQAGLSVETASAYENESVTPTAGNSPMPNHLTPLRVKGMVTDRKYSPSVSTSSLQQLIISPIISEESEKTSNDDVKSPEDSDVHSPRNKRSRKRLKV